MASDNLMRPDFKQPNIVFALLIISDKDNKDKLFSKMFVLHLVIKPFEFSLS